MTRQDTSRSRTGEGRTPGRRSDRSSTPWTGRRKIGAALVATAGLTFAAPQAWAMMPGGLFNAPPVSDGELSTMRGGFSIAGMQFSFGFAFMGKVNHDSPFNSHYELKFGDGIATTFNRINHDNSTTPVHGTGVVNSVVVDSTGNTSFDTHTTHDVGGMLSIIQNAMDQAHIQTTTKVTVDITDTMHQFQTLRNNAGLGSIFNSFRYQSVLGLN